MPAKNTSFNISLYGYVKQKLEVID